MDTLKIFEYLENNFSIGPISPKHPNILFFMEKNKKNWFGIEAGDELKEEVNKVFNIGDSADPIIVDWVNSKGITVKEDFLIPPPVYTAEEFAEILPAHRCTVKFNNK